MSAISVLSICRYCSYIHYANMVNGSNINQLVHIYTVIIYNLEYVVLVSAMNLEWIRKKINMM